MVRCCCMGKGERGLDGRMGGFVKTYGKVKVVLAEIATSVASLDDHLLAADGAAGESL